MVKVKAAQERLRSQLGSAAGFMAGVVGGSAADGLDVGMGPPSAGAGDDGANPFAQYVSRLTLVLL